MRDFAPGVGGKLVLWHGEPGTGKTYALRTLAWEWRDWCDFHYVIDPQAAGPAQPLPRPGAGQPRHPHAGRPRDGSTLAAADP